MRTTFVGRERELSELVSACESSADSHTHLFLIHGEPGIGKTRLADQLAWLAKARGTQVVWGRCWEDGSAPPYWPGGEQLAADWRLRDLQIRVWAATSDTGRRRYTRRYEDSLRCSK